MTTQKTRTNATFERQRGLKLREDTITFLTSDKFITTLRDVLKEDSLAATIELTRRSIDQQFSVT